ncbi:hypothetical protein [Streptomyces erythrochromogenes]|uniref:hypothetical protein n=1 Tax=Streptomyces erythrochromogenes TaxID=285574 RepID=UPI00370203E5
MSTEAEMPASSYPAIATSRPHGWWLSTFARTRRPGMSGRLVVSKGSTSELPLRAGVRGGCPVTVTP